MRRSVVGLLILCMTVLSLHAEVRQDSVSAHSDRKQEALHDITGAVSGIVINAALTEVIKNSVHEMRPDRSDNRSFPSRHASYAFTFADIAAHELCRFSPLWAVSAQTVANAVGMQRVYASRHYPGDVLAGAALGIFSTEIGYLLADKIFPIHAKHTLAPIDNSLSLSASTVALIAFGSHNKAESSGCGIESALHVAIPTSEVFGVGVSAGVRSQPVYRSGVYTGSLNGVALSTDAYVCRSMRLWMLTGLLSVGVIHNFDRPADVASAWSMLGRVNFGVERRLVGKLSAGVRVGCDVADRAGASANLSVALTTRAEF